MTLKIAMQMDQNEQISNYDRPASEVVQIVSTDQNAKCSLCVVIC